MGEFSGSLENVGLPAILRFLEGLGKTGSLQVSLGGLTGAASLTGGRVVAASFETERGVAALEAIMLALPGGSFTFSDGIPSDEPNVALESEELDSHLEAFAEERTRLAAATPSLRAVPRVHRAPGTDGQVVLDKASIETLLAVNGERTIEEISRGHGVVETARELARLLENGLISLEPTEPEATVASPDGSAIAARKPLVLGDHPLRPSEDGVVSRGMLSARAQRPPLGAASPALASFRVRIAARFRDRQLLTLALALAFCLAGVVCVLVAADGLPYVSDGNESFSTYVHAQNMLRFGPWSTMGLTDEANSPDPSAHPYIYTHQGNFPRFVSWILLLLGLGPIEWHIAIISLVVGLASTYLCYRFFSVAASGGFALTTCAVLWTDYLLFVQWQSNTFRVWHAFFIFALLYSVQSLHGRNARRVLGAMLLITFLLFYFELVFAVFTATFAAIYALLLHRRSVRLALSAWGAMALGGMASMGLLVTQLIAYLGWDLALQDLRMTYVARNFAKGIVDSEERRNVLRFFLDHHIVFWDSFDATNYLSIGALTKTVGSTVLAVYTPYLVLLIVIVSLGLALGGLIYHLSRALDRVSSPFKDDGWPGALPRLARVPTCGVLVLACYVATALVFGDATRVLPDGSLMDAVGLPQQLLDTRSVLGLLTPLALGLVVGSAMWRWLARVEAPLRTGWIVGVFVGLVALYMLGHREFYPDRSVMLWLKDGQGFVPPLVLQVVLIASLCTGAYLAASGGGRRLLWSTHGGALRGAAGYLAAGTGSFGAVYLLSPGYLYGGYLSRYSPIAVFVSDVVIAVFVYVLLILATEAKRRLAGSSFAGVRGWLARGRVGAPGVPWASAGLLAATSILLLGAGFYWLRLQSIYALNLPPTAALFLKQLTTGEYHGATFVSDNYALPISYFTGAWAYQDQDIAENQLVRLEDGDGLSIAGKYEWFADRETNDAYLRPRYYLCRTNPNADTIADLLMQPADGRVTRCSGEAIVKSALVGGGGRSRNELRLSDESRSDSWAIVALDPAVRVLPSWDAEPPTARGEEPTSGVWAFRGGFHASELPLEPLPRWTAGPATVEVYPRVKDRVALSMQLVQPDFGILRAFPDLAILVDDAPVPPESWDVVQDPPGHFQISLTLAPATRPRLPLRVEFRSPVFIPAQREEGSSDTRTLGIRIEALEIRSHGEELSAAVPTNRRVRSATME